MSANLLTEEIPHTALPERELEELVIEPAGPWQAVNWKEIWRYRELLYFLAWRDVKVRYKQTTLGAAWAILQPFLSMVVFSLFFGRLAGLEHRMEVPYPIFVYTGQLAWTFFSSAVTSASGSVVGSSYLITKVYFPRLIIPISAVCVALVDFGVSSVVLFGMMAYYKTALSWQLLLTPIFLAGTVLAATGVGTLLAALTVAYRDFRYVVPFMLQIWMFVTPVIYPSTIVPERWRWLLSLNPMTGLVDGFRAGFLNRPMPWGEITVSLGISVLVFFAGAAYYRLVERRFADII